MCRSWPPKLVSNHLTPLLGNFALTSIKGVLPDQIYCDGWSIGYDERFPQSRRVQQALVFARYGQHENLYAHPMVCSSLTRPFPLMSNVIRTSCPSLTPIRRRYCISTFHQYGSLRPTVLCCPWNQPHLLLHYPSQGTPSPPQIGTGFLLQLGNSTSCQI